MKTTRFIILVVIGLWPLQVGARDLVVFAAASLKEPIDQIAADFGDVVVSYGGSGTLARQIGFGAPADIVVLAHPRWMDVLADANLLAVRAPLVGNTLVLISSNQGTVDLSLRDFDAALGDGRLALGLVGAVPAGIYAKAALDELGLWNSVRTRLAEVDSVRAALALVARKESPLGIVYATDARVSEDVHIVATFPADSYPEIRYEYGVVASSRHPNVGAFAAALAASTVFEQAGFLPLADAE